MKESTTIDEAWENFSGRFCLSHFPKTQQNTIKKAYYTGAYEALQIVEVPIGESKEELKPLFKRLFAECFELFEVWGRGGSVL